MIFWASLSLSSPSLLERLLVATAEDDALPEDWRYRGLGEGVVAEDEGVAMAAERVATSVVVVADVMAAVEGSVADDGRGGGQ